MGINEFFKKYEFKRKLFHFLMGLFFVAVLNLEIKEIQDNLIILILVALIISLALSIYTRYREPAILIRLLSLFDKPRDLKKFPAKGAIFYLIGMLTAVAFFSREIASASILILALGDPAAHIIGSYYGKRKLVINRRKLLEGTLGGVFFGTIGATFFVPFPLAFFGAAFGMMAEAIELETLHLDDNFFIPFVSGMVMTLIQGLM